MFIDLLFLLLNLWSVFNGPATGNIPEAPAHTVGTWVYKRPVPPPLPSPPPPPPLPI